jgi:RHS repeat-associated protein
VSSQKEGNASTQRSEAGEDAGDSGWAVADRTNDGDGLRVARNADGQTMAYARDLAAALPKQLGDGSALYLPGVGRWDGQEWTYSLPDGLGSVRQLAGEQAHLLQRYDYSPFGRVVAAEGERENPLQYTGEYWDADAGLLYLRARWYHPAIGRFLTRDPFPGLALLPQTQHDYVYVGNNPVNFTDPTRESAFIPLALVAPVGRSAIRAVRRNEFCTLRTLPLVVWLRALGGGPG